MPSRAGAQFGRRGGASIPSLSLLIILTGREGSWEEVFLVFNVNQETLWGCGWEGRGKRLGAGEGISVAGGTEIPSSQRIRVCACACVCLWNGSARVASFFSDAVFLQFCETIFRKPFRKTTAYHSFV